MAKDILIHMIPQIAPHFILPQSEATLNHPFGVKAGLSQQEKGIQAITFSLSKKISCIKIS